MWNALTNETIAFLLLTTNCIKNWFEMKTELKKLIAVKLLDWSFKIMPDCKFKIELAKLMTNELLKGMD